MKRFCVAVFCSIVFVTLICVKPHPGFAQQSPQQEWRSLRVYHVRPDMMAYFIDPEHQKEPIEFKIPSLNDPHYSSQDFIQAITSGAPPLNFAGVLTVDTHQNTLWVLSDLPTFDQTKRFVEFMDHPLPQCELELQIVKVRQEDLTSLETKPLQPAPNSPSQHAPYQLSILTAESQLALQSRLHQLISEGKANILNSPRITTINHLRGSIASSRTTPVFIGIKNEKTPSVPLAAGSIDDQPIDITSQLRTTFTPHINDSTDTISLDLHVSVNEGLSKLMTEPGKAFSLFHNTVWLRDRLNPPLVTTLNVKNNQTVIISGLDSTMLGFDKNQDQVALFLTVRIMRPAE